MSMIGIPAELPILPILNEVVFPGHYVRIAVTNEKGRRLVNTLLSKKNDRLIGVCTVEGDKINSNTIRKIGVVANVSEINRLLHKPGYLIVAKALTRFRVKFFLALFLCDFDNFFFLKKDREFRE